MRERKAPGIIALEKEGQSRDIVTSEEGRRPYQGRKSIWRSFLKKFRQTDVISPEIKKPGSIEILSDATPYLAQSENLKLGLIIFFFRGEMLGTDLGGGLLGRSINEGGKGGDGVFSGVRGFVGCPQTPAPATIAKQRARGGSSSPS